MSVRSGAEPKVTAPRLSMDCPSSPRGNPSGSHVMNGSFDTCSVGGFGPPRVASPYDLRSLKAARPAGVIGGIGSGLPALSAGAPARGPTHVPDRSRFGAGPGGFGIFTTPWELTGTPAAPRP